MLTSGFVIPLATPGPLFRIKLRIPISARAAYATTNEILPDDERNIYIFFIGRRLSSIESMSTNMVAVIGAVESEMKESFLIRILKGPLRR